MSKRAGICFHCLQPITRGQQTVELEGDDIAHEECYLRNSMKYYEESLKGTSEFEELLEDFQDVFGECMRLWDEIKRTSDETKAEEFRESWSRLFHLKTELERGWLKALSYFAPKSAGKRLTASLLGRPFLRVKKTKESQKWDDRWWDLHSTFADYFSLHGPKSWIAEIEALMGEGSAERRMQSMDRLVEEMRSLTRQVVMNSGRDVNRYWQDLHSEYQDWVKNNAASLRKYGL